MNVTSEAPFERLAQDIVRRQQAAQARFGPVLAKVLPLYSLLWRPATSIDERRRLVTQVFEPDGFYCDPMVDPLGPQPLVEHISSVVTPLLPDYVLEKVGESRINGRYLTFSWLYLDSEGRPASFTGSWGIDVITVSDRGRLLSVVGFFETTLSTQKPLCTPKPASAA